MAQIKTFPKPNEAFLTQTEQLINTGEDFRKDPKWPRYLESLKKHGFKYIVIQGRSVLYLCVRPKEVRPSQIINIAKEIKLSSKSVMTDERLFVNNLSSPELVSADSGGC